MSTILKPLAHQTETIDSLNKQFSENHNKALVVLPSGSGKTHTIAFHVAQLKPKTFLYIVHRNEILNQTVKIFKEVCGLKAYEVGIINQHKKEFDRPYLFASIQTLVNEKNLDKMAKHIEYVVIDEYHHVAADSYDKVITKHFKPKYMVGLTATPYRLDKKDIMKYVDNNIAANVDLFEGIGKDILAPFHYIGLWDNIDYSEIRWSGHKYNIADLDRRLIIHKRDEAVLEEYKKRIEPEGRLTIAFCNSVDHVTRIVKKFNDIGIKSVGITYKENVENRQEILDNFKQGHYKVLFTRDILNEGVDFPECSAIMFLRPTISQTVFFQQLGRGLLKMQGKKNVLVLDYIGNYERAFQKREWFKMFKKEGVTTGENIKPYYEYSPHIQIHFDPKIVQMMDMQESMFKTVSNQDIFQDYVNCCKKEDKDFLSKAEYKRSVHRKYNLKRLVYRYGSFKEFLYEHNLQPYEGYGIQKSPINFYNCEDKDKLIKNYYKVKKKWLEEGGKNHGIMYRNCPPLSVINSMRYSSYGAINYKNIWKKYSSFLKEIGEIDNTKLGFIYGDTHEIKYTKVINAVKDLQKKLGRKFFTYSEWRKAYGGFAEGFERQDGGWKGFKKKFGIAENVTLKCKKCNKPFQTHSGRKVFCSRGCMDSSVNRK